ncbi:hypothetical protein HY389_01345 [Candidatus Daviesbacteria bacterium]|nr:hypothetical protein [Candidatus Daviesbacteria bacterium]
MERVEIVERNVVLPLRGNTLLQSARDFLAALSELRHPSRFLPFPTVKTEVLVLHNRNLLNQEHAIRVRRRGVDQIVDPQGKRLQLGPTDSVIEVLKS